jgi:hypothetical protein
VSEELISIETERKPPSRLFASFLPFPFQFSPPSLFSPSFLFFQPFSPLRGKKVRKKEKKKKKREKEKNFDGKK